MFYFFLSNLNPSLGTQSGEWAWDGFLCERIGQEIHSDFGENLHNGDIVGCYLDLASGVKLKGTYRSVFTKSLAKWADPKARKFEITSKNRIYLAF